MTTRRIRLEYAAASVVISLLLSGVFGSWYFSTKIQEAFGAMCDILVISTQPYPQPPAAPNVPAPTTEYGKALQEYNRKVANRQKEGLRALNKAVEEYDCKR